MTGPFVPVVHGAHLDRPDEADTLVAAESVRASLERQGFAAEIIAIGPDLEALTPLVGRRPFVVFNLVEALGGIAIDAVRALERLDQLGLGYTGTRTAAYRAATSKLETKVQLQRAGIATPRHWLAGDDVADALRVIVKSVDEHGSLGIDQGSVVDGDRASDEIAAREARFGGRFFAEAFIAGREFNVSVLEMEDGPVVLPMAEIDFAGLPDETLAIVDFTAKWDPAAPSYQLTPRRFGVEAREADLARELARLSLASWHALGLSGYGRVDFRVDRDGRVFVLEVNANPCISPDAGFAAAALEAGLDYDCTIAAIIAAATKRQRVAS